MSAVRALTNPHAFIKRHGLRARLLKYAGLLPERLLMSVVSRFVRRRADLWVFGSGRGRRFADNARHFFVACIRERAAHCVWISSDQEIVQAVRELGHPAHHRRSLAGMWCSLRAGVYVYDSTPDDINYGASFKALRVNLWHGVPLKRIERDIDTPSSPIWRGLHGSMMDRAKLWLRAPWIFHPPHLVIATSEKLKPIFASAFGVPSCSVLVSGYPRNDAALNVARSTDLEMLVNPGPGRVTKRGGKAILYMPTFRDEGATPLPTPAQQKELSALLRAFDAKLYLKLHPLDVGRLTVTPDVDSIAIIPSAVDVYEAIGDADILVTDYSSVFFDFLLFDRPLIFYCPDLDIYQTRDRGMYFDYDDVTPGPKALSWDQFLRALAQTLRGDHDEFGEARKRVAKQFHTYSDGRSSQRIQTAIKALKSRASCSSRASC